MILKLFVNEGKLNSNVTSLIIKREKLENICRKSTLAFDMRKSLFIPMLVVKLI